MRVISRRKLVDAAEQHGDLAGALDAWYKLTKQANWTSITDVRLLFSTADVVGTCTVFNIRGNRYRLIAWIKSQKLFIRHVLTHAEYDKGAWKNECFVS